MDSSDFAKGIAFIVRNKDNLLLHCAGPTEAYVVEQTLAALARPVETQPGSPNFDGAAAYEAYMDAQPREVCPTCKGTKRAQYEGFGWCTCETCTAPPCELLPLPEKVSSWLRRMRAYDNDGSAEWVERHMQAYARANVERALAESLTEIAGLRYERDVARECLREAYAANKD